MNVWKKKNERQVFLYRMPKLEQDRGVHKIRGGSVFVAHEAWPRTRTLAMGKTPHGPSGRKVRLLDSLRYPHVGARG